VCDVRGCGLTALEIPHTHPRPEYNMAQAYADLARRYPNGGPHWSCHHTRRDIPALTDPSPQAPGLEPAAWRMRRAKHRYSIRAE
jgi:hypothetical protein